jgi:hypothetical protein
MRVRQPFVARFGSAPRCGRSSRDVRNGGRFAAILTPVRRQRRLEADHAVC